MGGWGAAAADYDEATTGALQALPPGDNLKFLNDMRDRLSHVKTMKMRFRQERRLRLFEDSLVSTGTCFYKFPDGLRWQLTEPYESLLIYRDGKVARFEKEDGRFQKKTSGAETLQQEVMRQIAGWINGDVAGQSKDYGIRIEVGAFQRITMRPKSKALREYVEAVELEIDPQTLRARRIILREPGEDYMSIRFDEYQENIELGDDLFSLTAPRL